MRAGLALLVGAIGVVGCGTLGGSSGGVSNPPDTGLGPYVAISMAQAPKLTVPLVLSDPTSAMGYADSDALVDGDQLVMYVTSGPADGSGGLLSNTSIARASTRDVRLGFDTPTVVLSADQAWEGAGISHPSVLRLGDGSDLLFYGSAGGSIGVARAAAGAPFSKLGVILDPAVGADHEGTPLSSPSVVQIGSRLRLFYVADGMVWAADSTLADWTSATGSQLPVMQRLDANGDTPARDPFVVAKGSVDASIDRACARVATTELGRSRFDLYFSGPPVVPGSPLAGFASAYADDEPLETAAQQLIFVLLSSSPDVLPYANDFVLFYGSESGAAPAIAMGVGPDVAF